MKLLGTAVGKQLFLTEPSEFEQLPAALPSSGPFGLFIAASAEPLTDDALEAVARELINRGTVYVSAWGPGCERIHDAVDHAQEEWERAGNAHPNPSDVVMTTWHTDEELEEAFEFFVLVATPTESYIDSCEDWFAAVLGSPAWSARIRTAAAELVRAS